MDEKTHFLWIETMVSRVVGRISKISRKPLLSISFAEKFPDPVMVKLLPDEVNLFELSKGIHYSIIVHLLREHSFYRQNPREIFRCLLQVLNSLGYIPGNPCDPESLCKGRLEDHLNLCRALEYAVSERALTAEQLIEDLRKVPRSFFVLKDFSTHLDNMIRIWLNKFPCLVDLFEMEDVQSEIGTYAHIAGVLSRVFPSRIPKESIRKSKYLEQSEIEQNRTLAFSVLNELGAFIPDSFPVEEKLLRIVVAELYYATRQGVRSFVRIDASQVIQFGVSAPKTARLKLQRSPQHKSKKTHPVFRPKTSRRSDRCLVRFERNENAELLDIYRYMSMGSRKEKFIGLDDPKFLVDILVALMEGPDEDQTFLKFSENIREHRECQSLMHNGIAFLSALSGNNNEYGASRRVVLFARIMMSTLSLLTQIQAPKSARVVRRPTRRFAVTEMVSLGTQTTDGIAMFTGNETSLKKKAGKMIRKQQESQTEISVERPKTANTFSTISYPYGANCRGISARGRRPVSVRKTQSRCLIVC